MKKMSNQPLTVTILRLLSQLTNSISLWDESLLTLETLKLGDAQNHHQTTIYRCTRWWISALGAEPGHTNRRCFILNLDPLDDGNTNQNFNFNENTREKIDGTTEFIFLSQRRANTTNCPTKSALIAIILAPVTLIVATLIFNGILFYCRGKASATALSATAWLRGRDDKPFFGDSADGNLDKKPQSPQSPTPRPPAELELAINATASFPDISLESIGQMTAGQRRWASGPRLDKNWLAVQFARVIFQTSRGG
ncbi:hypothetical protein BGZ57DRAFT_1001931 [Hyaloscypha finlandica]|nr:hypothetical protein BGZ57DRAFT_1001931 [Hyaloscypha finlandica]